jgi:hypothetical protein
MSQKPAIDLYELLPALYRLRDAERGYPLHALLEIIAGQVDILKGDIDGLWDDFFIETCDEWVIPYIGELVGNNLLHTVDLPLRADVAKTVYYRRRKGTLPMLEELARDVTGWGAHAVAFFERLNWTQNLNHLRLAAASNPQRRDPPSAMDWVGTVNLRSMDLLDRLNGPFDMTSHFVDVCSIAQSAGWHGISKVGFFLWRLSSYRMEGATPCPSVADSNGFHFSTLGNQTALFNYPQREIEASDLASEIHVPALIRPLAFYYHTADYYGHGKSIAIYRGPVVAEQKLVPLQDILCKNLNNWDLPPSGKVAVDPSRGRLAFAANEVPATGVTVSYNYGFSADIGGGPYDRRNSLEKTTNPEIWIKTVAQHDPTADFSSLIAALSAWANPNDGNHGNALINIRDNGCYSGTINIEPGDHTTLVIQADNGFRPTLSLGNSLTLTGKHPEAEVTLNGLLIEGSIRVENSLGKLNVLNCTLVPGHGLKEDEDHTPLKPTQPSLWVAKTNTQLRIILDSSIVGALRVPDTMAELTLQDSIVDGLQGAAIAGAAGASGPPTTLVRSTVFGAMRAKELSLASEVIFDGLVTVQRKQSGCVRFCYLPYLSQTPRRYRCQPDLALLELAKCGGQKSVGALSTAQKAPLLARLQPAFASKRYSDPRYAQLSRCCPEEIRTGAEDGAEMGVFCQLKQPQREANLRLRLEEYLPFGLEGGMIFVT